MRLDGLLDTADTVATGEVHGAGRSIGDLKVEKLEPTFKGPEDGNSSLDWWKTLPPLARATTAVVAVIVAFGAPSVWWVSKLDTNVDNLKTNVSEIRTRTDDLFRTSVQQGDRLETVEKSIDTLKAESKASPSTPTQQPPAMRPNQKSS